MRVLYEDLEVIKALKCSLYFENLEYFKKHNYLREEIPKGCVGIYANAFICKR